MKYKKIILALLLAMVVGDNGLVYNGVAYASGAKVESTQSQMGEESLAELYHKANLDSPEVIINTLVTLGISKAELQEAIAGGKKIYDILQEKEITMVRFKKALTEEYQCRINQAKKDKVITRKEAKVLTNLLKERMDQWEI